MPRGAPSPSEGAIERLGPSRRDLFSAAFIANIAQSRFRHTQGDSHATWNKFAAM
jgi:hypothetical protein